MDSDGILKFDSQLCVLRVGDSIQLILCEAYDSRYYIQPGTTKMYLDLRQHYKWDDMKRNIADDVSPCLSS